MTKNILFVCTGNACRSPLAETILLQKLAERNITDIEVSSVGTLNWGENPRDEVMVGIAAEHGYTMTGTTTYMTEAALNSADVIIVFSDTHRDQITSMLCYDHWCRIVPFRQYAFQQEGWVTDPSGGTEFLYRQVFDLIERGCEQIAERLAAQQ